MGKLVLGFFFLGRRPNFIYSCIQSRKKALKEVRSVVGDDVWILAPGVGAQGAQAKDVLKAGMDRNGRGILVPISRGISKAKDRKAAAKAFWEEIEEARGIVNGNGKVFNVTLN